MATNPDTSDDYVRRLNREADQIEAEARKLRAEASRVQAKQSLAMSRQTWMDWFVYLHTGWFLLFVIVLSITIMGLGGAIMLLLRSLV